MYLLLTPYLINLFKDLANSCSQIHQAHVIFRHIILISDSEAEAWTQKASNLLTRFGWTQVFQLSLLIANSDTIQDFDYLTILDQQFQGKLLTFHMILTKNFGVYGVNQFTCSSFHISLLVSFIFFYHSLYDHFKIFTLNMKTFYTLNLAMYKISQGDQM